jgi:hypothetical protein
MVDGSMQENARSDARGRSVPHRMALSKRHSATKRTSGKSSVRNERIHLGVVEQSRTRQKSHAAAVVEREHAAATFDDIDDQLI